MNVFTDKLDYLLEINGQRRADLSRAVSIPETSIRNWYTGKIPSVLVAIKIAQYYGVTVEWLFSDAGIESIKKRNELNIQPELELPEISALSFQEHKLIEVFRKLETRDKNAVLIVAQTLEKCVQ